MAFLRDRSVFCIPGTILPCRERKIIGGICLFTSSIGFAGAALQLKSLRQYRNRQRRRPSSNPEIVFYLALSDLVACAGVFALAICLIVLDEPEPPHGSEKYYRPKHDSIYAPIGTAIEIFTLLGYLASHVWTLSFALDMCFQIYGIDCAMVVYHILAWAIPMELVIIIEAINFGKYPYFCAKGTARLSRVLLSYTPVAVVMLANPVIFLVTYKKVKQLLRASGSFTAVDRAALKKCKKKFLWIVVVFTVCWIPNIISLSYFVITFDPQSESRKSVLDQIWYVEAVVNPLQGLFNYFVYRNAFRVTATDTRPGPNSLPRVPCPPSLVRYFNRARSPRPIGNQSLQRISSSQSSLDEKNPLLRPPSKAAVPRYVYISRLLGE